jgi:hypothetical protein
VYLGERGSGGKTNKDQNEEASQAGNHQCWAVAGGGDRARLAICGLGTCLQASLQTL